MDGCAAGWSSDRRLVLYYDDDENDNDDDENDDDDNNGGDDDDALRMGMRNRPSLIRYGLRCYSEEPVDYVRFVDLKAE